MQIVDFTNLPKRNKMYAGANGSKISVIYEGQQYMLKFPPPPTKNKDMSYSNSCFSEYLGCQIYESIGIPVQKTMLGTYTVKGKSSWYDAVELAFGGDAETQTWLEKINVTSVKVNGTNGNLASSTYESNFASKFYIRKGENPSYVYIGTALLTQEQNKIEITVDGYNTLEITVDKNGNEVK